MKKVTEYLKECLNEEDYQKALSNMTAQYAEEDSIETLTATDQVDALISAFTWGPSREGFDYWRKLYDDLKEKYPLEN